MKDVGNGPRANFYYNQIPTTETTLLKYNSQ